MSTPPLGQVFFTKPSRTQQHHAESLDLPTVVASIKRQTGKDLLRTTGFVEAKFGDFNSDIDLPTILDANRLANEAFESLPSVLRAKFNDSVSDFCSYCSNPLNHKAMLDLGILPALATGVTSSTPITAPVPPSTPVSGGSDALS